MSHKKSTALIISLMGSSLFWLVQKLRKAFKLDITNRVDKTVDLFVGTETDPTFIKILDLKTDETRKIDLTEIPMRSKEAIILTIPAMDEQPAIRRTLIAPNDKHTYKLQASLVEYGNGIIDLRLVRKS